MIAINIDGKIKTFSDYPTTWKDAGGNDITPYQFADEETKYEDGFRPFVTPQLTAGQKLGAKIYDAVNDVFTYAIIDKTPEDLAQETANAKEQEKEKIKEAKIKAYVESVLTPTERLTYYPEHILGKAYPLKERVTFKGKVFENTLEGNINAPDKGGWIEIK